MARGAGAADFEDSNSRDRVARVFSRSEKEEGSLMFYVYEIREGDSCVYVGVTSRPKNRLSAHRSKGTAGPDAEMVIVAEFNSRDEALKCERARIRDGMPPKNQQWLTTGKIRPHDGDNGALTEALHEAIEAAGGAGNWAKSLGLSRQYAYSVAYGRTRPSQKILDNLGLDAVVSYEIVE